MNFGGSAPGANATRRRLCRRLCPVSTTTPAAIAFSSTTTTTITSTPSMSSHTPALQVRQAPPQARGTGLGIALPPDARPARRKTVTFDEMLEVQEYPPDASATVSTSATLSTAAEHSATEAVVDMHPSEQQQQPHTHRSISISSQPDISHAATEAQQQQLFAQLASSPRLGPSALSPPPGRPAPPPLDTSIDATRDAGPPILLRGQTPPPLREAKRAPQPSPEKLPHAMLTPDGGADTPLLSPLERMIAPRAPRVSAGLGQLGTGLDLPDYWVGLSRLSEQDEESSSALLPHSTSSSPLAASVSSPDIEENGVPTLVKMRPRRSRSVDATRSPLRPGKDKENEQLPTLSRMEGEDFSHGLQRELSRIQKRQPQKYKVHSRKTISVRDTDLPPPPRPASPIKMVRVSPPPPRDIRSPPY